MAKLYAEFGQGWRALNLPKIHRGQNAFISNEYLDDIIQYAGENHRTSRSSYETAIEEFVQTIYTKKVECNTRQAIKPYELDIFIPSKNIAVEVDGIRWHSINVGMDKDYRLMKTNLCQEREIYDFFISQTMNFLAR